VLEQRLNEAGYHAAVIDTGFHYTSRAGLDGLEQGRVDLSAPDTVAIVELGSNDCPDGLALGETRANLGQILAKLTEAKIPVLLVGTAAFAFCGADYVAAFEQMFVDLSEKYGTLFYPEFRAGALGHPELLQDDGDHPNEAGEVVVVNRMLPLVEELIARVQPQQGEASPRQAGLSPDWSLP
jgi:acyl-CoA thioesterase-1